MRLKLNLAPKTLSNLEFLESKNELGIKILDKEKNGVFTDVTVNIESIDKTLIFLLMNLKSIKK